MPAPRVAAGRQASHVRGIEAGAESLEEVHVFHGEFHETIRVQIRRREKFLHVGVVASRDGTEGAVGRAVEQVLAERVSGRGSEAPHEVDAEVVEEAEVLLGDDGRVGGCVEEDGTIRDREQESVGCVDAERGDQGGDVRGLRCDEE